MMTPISITSLSQGQIFGAKPSLEEIERQLEADPMTRACHRCVVAAAWLVANLRRLGNRTLVYTRMADGSLLTAQDDGNSSVQPNQTVGLSFDMAQSHFFDASGKAYHAG
jgi:multiple sugar transport system ATP-binding protein